MQERLVKIKSDLLSSFYWQRWKK